MVSRTQRTLRNLNRIMSDDYQKLSDKYDDLKLSHKRQVRLLKSAWLYLCDYADFLQNESYYEEEEKIRSFLPKIIDEITSPLYRCFNKKKGGKKCG